MSQNAKFAKGMRLLCNGAVASENVALTPPGKSWSSVTATDHEDDAAVSLPGEKSFSDLVLSVNFINDTVQQAFESACDNRTRGIYSVIYPYNFSTPFLTYDYTGWVKSIKPATPINGLATWEVTIAITGRSTPSGVITPLTGLTIADEDSHALTLSPSFSGTVYNYDATAYTTSASVLITPTCAAAGTIYVNGVAVASGAASGAITLNANLGDITNIFIVPTKANCKTPVTRIRVTMGLAAYV